jgi:hypothetical protein
MVFRDLRNIWEVIAMKIRPVFFCMVVMFFAATVGYTQDSPEQQVREAMDENFAAMLHKDANALNREYADDYFRIGPTGKTQGKAETLKDVREPGLQNCKA